MDTYINLSLVAGGDMIYTYDELACSDCRQVYLGVLLHENFRVDRLQMTDDGICQSLQTRRGPGASSSCCAAARVSRPTASSFPGKWD